MYSQSMQRKTTQIGTAKQMSNKRSSSSSSSSSSSTYSADFTDDSSKSSRSRPNSSRQPTKPAVEANNSATAATATTSVQEEEIGKAAVFAPAEKTYDDNFSDDSSSKASSRSSSSSPRSARFAAKVRAAPTAPIVMESAAPTDASHAPVPSVSAVEPLAEKISERTVAADAAAAAEPPTKTTTTQLASSAVTASAAATAKKTAAAPAPSSRGSVTAPAVVTAPAAAGGAASASAVAVAKAPTTSAPTPSTVAAKKSSAAAPPSAVQPKKSVPAALPAAAPPPTKAAAAVERPQQAQQQLQQQSTNAVQLQAQQQQQQQQQQRMPLRPASSGAAATTTAASVPVAQRLKFEPEDEFFIGDSARGENNNANNADSNNSREQRTKKRDVVISPPPLPVSYDDRTLLDEAAVDAVHPAEIVPRLSSAGFVLANAFSSAAQGGRDQASAVYGAAFSGILPKDSLALRRALSSNWEGRLPPPPKLRAPSSKQSAAAPPISYCSSSSAASSSSSLPSAQQHHNAGLASAWTSTRSGAIVVPVWAPSTSSSSSSSSSFSAAGRSRNNAAAESADPRWWAKAAHLTLVGGGEGDNDEPGTQSTSPSRRVAAGAGATGTAMDIVALTNIDVAMPSRVYGLPMQLPSSLVAQLTMQQQQPAAASTAASAATAAKKKPTMREIMQKTAVAEEDKLVSVETLPPYEKMTVLGCTNQSPDVCWVILHQRKIRPPVQQQQQQQAKKKRSDEQQQGDAVKPNNSDNNAAKKEEFSLADDEDADHNKNNTSTSGNLDSSVNRRDASNSSIMSEESDLSTINSNSHARQQSSNNNAKKHYREIGRGWRLAAFHTVTGRWVEAPRPILTSIRDPKAPADEAGSGGAGISSSSSSSFFVESALSGAAVVYISSTCSFFYFGGTHLPGGCCALPVRSHYFSRAGHIPSYQQQQQQQQGSAENNNNSEAMIPIDSYELHNAHAHLIPGRVGHSATSISDTEVVLCGGGISAKRRQQQQEGAAAAAVAKKSSKNQGGNDFFIRGASFLVHVDISTGTCRNMELGGGGPEKTVVVPRVRHGAAACSDGRDRFLVLGGGQAAAEIALHHQPARAHLHLHRPGRIRPANSGAAAAAASSLHNDASATTVVKRKSHNILVSIINLELLEGMDVAVAAKEVPLTGVPSAAPVLAGRLNPLVRIIEAPGSLKERQLQPSLALVADPKTGEMRGMGRLRSSNNNRFVIGIFGGLKQSLTGGPSAESADATFVELMCPGSAGEMQHLISQQPMLAITMNMKNSNDYRQAADPRHSAPLNRASPVPVSFDACRDEAERHESGRAAAGAGGGKRHATSRSSSSSSSATTSARRSASSSPRSNRPSSSASAQRQKQATMMPSAATPEPRAGASSSSGNPAATSSTAVAIYHRHDEANDVSRKQQQQQQQLAARRSSSPPSAIHSAVRRATNDSNAALPERVRLRLLANRHRALTPQQQGAMADRLCPSLQTRLQETEALTRQLTESMKNDFGWKSVGKGADPTIKKKATATPAGMDQKPPRKLAREEMGRLYDEGVARKKTSRKALIDKLTAQSNQSRNQAVMNGDDFDQFIARVYTKRLGKTAALSVGGSVSVKRAARPASPVVVAASAPTVFESAPARPESVSPPVPPSLSAADHEDDEL